MTRLLLIASILFLSRNIVKCDKFSPSETLNYFCPCRIRSSCTTTFGDPGPVFQDILKVIPTCTGTRVRCCSKDVLFTAIMIILNDREIEKDDDGTIEVESKDGQKQKFLASGVPAQLNGKGRFFGNFEKELVKTPQDPIAPAAAKSRFLGALTGRTSKNLPQGLVCVPLHQCGNVYGTNGQHVLKFGFISPLETGCLANAGNILCVMENGEVTTPATSTTVPAFSALPAGRNEFAAFSFATNGNGDIVSSVNNNGNVVNSVSVSQEELPCTLPKDCLNIYGTDGSHFDRYEIQQSCPRGDQVRCVQSPSSQPKPVLPSFPQLPLIPGLPAIPSFPGLPGLSIPVFVPPTTPPQIPTSPEIPAATGVHGAHGHHIHLPCVPQQECQVIYGTLGDHFNTYGVQQACKRDSFVRCITIKEEEKTTSPVSVGSGGHGHTHANNQPLPCVPQLECQEIYGVLGTHFDTFGIQQGCPGDHLVRCVKVGGGNTPPVTQPTPPITPITHPTPPITHPTPPITPPTPPITLPTRPVTAPSYGGGLPVGPVAPSVSIIGPQPIYVSYNNIKGPSVGIDNSLASDGQVDSSGINSSQESQINLLLRGLKEKLRNILHG